MPSATLSLPKNTTFEFKIKVSQDGTILTPPSTIAAGAFPGGVAGLTRQADAGGRAVYRINGANEGSATVSIGSGSGTLNVAVTVTAAVAGPIVFELDGDFVQV